MPRSALPIGVLCLASLALSSGDVVINEIVATDGGRNLRWDANDQPFAGAGPAWWAPEFDDSNWKNGTTPIGYSLGTIATNVASYLQNTSPSLYLRGDLNASSGEAASGRPLILRINYNDGFVAWINGVEVARANMGADKAHIFHDQISYRGASGSTATEDFNLGAASALLSSGDNTIAIQLANRDAAGSMRLEFSLLIDEASGPDTVLVPFGSDVRYLPGLLEPGADVFEPALLDAPSLETDTSDWIELYNDGGAPVDLTGWTMTDDPALPSKWTFPAGTTIAAGGYLLVLADNPPAPIPGAIYPHANFKLGAGGDYLGLFDEAAALQSEIAPGYPKQYPFYSYGVAPGGGYAYLDAPSPGAANAGSAFTGKADAPDFDIEGGFHATSVSLTLTSETPGVTIRYTTDGTEPTETNGTVHTPPLVLNAISNKKGHVIRARAFAPGLIPSNTKTRTYLIAQDPRLSGSPALVFAGDLPRSLYDPFGALAINGGQYVSSRWQATGPADYNNVITRGRPYERPVHTEFYFSDGTPGFSTDCGVRVAASSYSRPRMQLNQLASSPWPASSVQKPSFNLYFRDDYGNPDVSLPLNGENAPVDTYERFRIRAGKNDIKNPFIIDELVRRLSHAMGQPASRGVINSLYINGELKGFYNMVERLREPYFRSLHSDDPDAQWDVIQHQSQNREENVAEGDTVAWNEMVTRLNQPETVANWESVLEIADVENIADYYLLNVYCATWDWPHNNWVGARERGPAGRWRLYIWDAEGAFNNRNNRPTNYNTINDMKNGSRELQELWRGLSRWGEFRLLFADRIHKHMFNGGVLDDRDYENSEIKEQFDALVGEFSDLLSFMNNENVQTSKPPAWASTTNGRRLHLVGPSGQQFRDNDLWPVTAPPEFSQFGGSVPDGFPLNITNESGEIYYTTDGSDPRLPGGAANPAAVAQPGSKIDLELIPAGAPWSYSDTDGDLGTAWRTAGYDSSSWSAGPGPLGYGGINDGATSINIPTQINPRHPETNLRQPTVYFLREFEIADAGAYLELRMRIMSDGGAAVYINGTEAFRDSNVPAGAAYSVLATNDASDSNEGDYDNYALDHGLLVTGTNTIAVELHNGSINSSDMVFDLQLEGTRTNPAAQPLPIEQPLTVMARSFDNGEWSALTVADFTVDTVPASSATLAVTEMLYNPAGPDAAELQAGFGDGDQFEFLQLKNIGTQSIDLHGVRFTDGIGFDFTTADIRSLRPGAVAIVVSDLAAFRERNGDAFDAVIAGDYTGRLNNGGEQVRIIDASGATLQEFSYAPTSPWPDLGALDGHSIVIIDPAGDHDDGANWRASSTVGGNPGGTLSYSAYRELYFTPAELTDPEISGPGADMDFDGLGTFAEFVLGTPPTSADNGVPMPSAGVEDIGGNNYLTMEYTVAPGSRAGSVSVEVSADCKVWSPTTQLVSETSNGDGSLTYKYRDDNPVDPELRPARFIRLLFSE